MNRILFLIPFLAALMSAQTYTVDSTPLQAGQLWMLSPTQTAIPSVSGAGFVGIAQAFAAGGSSITVTNSGSANCLFENATTSGDLIVQGTGTPLDCRDSGATSPSTIPAGTRIYGTASATASAGIIAVNLYSTPTYGTSFSSGGGSVTPTGTGADVVSASGAGSSGNCAKWLSTGDLGDAGVTCGSGSGATIASVTNLIKGDGGGNGIDSGLATASVVTLTGTQTLTNKTISSSQISGLGTAAAQATSYFDLSGAASTAQSAAVSTAETYSANASNLSSGTVPTAQLPTAMFTPPYLAVGGNFYLPSDHGFQATKPSLSGWSQLAGTTTPTAGTNGDELMSSTGPAWYSQATYTTSIEAVSETVGISGGGGNSGPFMWDSTNNLLYQCYELNSSGSYFELDKYTYSGSGTPSYSAAVAKFLMNNASAAHLKLSVSGGTLTCGVSLNGGANFITVGTASVGTIGKTGFYTGGTMDILSLKLQ